MQHPRPKPGARDSSDAGASLAGDAVVSSKSRAPIQASRNGAATARRRAHFARQATIDAFGWRYAKSLDQFKFVDRPARKRARRAWAVVVGAS